MRLFSKGLQTTSKCGKNIPDTLTFGSCVTFLFLPRDVICDLLLSRACQLVRVDLMSGRVCMGGHITIVWTGILTCTRLHAF